VLVGVGQGAWDLVLRSSGHGNEGRDREERKQN